MQTIILHKGQIGTTTNNNNDLRQNALEQIEVLITHCSGALRFFKAVSTTERQTVSLNAPASQPFSVERGCGEGQRGFRADRLAGCGCSRQARSLRRCRRASGGTPLVPSIAPGPRTAHEFAPRAVPLWLRPCERSWEKRGRGKSRDENQP
ncbi:unnamed protein product [Rangifer tarandus platyrhynchus]|uniref:Uncharacterized protein n=1 Tax=Rangifer tarandus platyrhynchus TaxID=3082113 RepID=A0ABN8ZCV0_RANTA|nr:unnamed protein product [Rangifer tarandus platyrhynchus]